MSTTSQTDGGEPAPRFVFVCGGPECSACGSHNIHSELAQQLDDAGVHDVIVRPFGCLGLCDHAVNLIVFPDGAWYGDVRPSDIAEIAMHASGGPALERRILHNVDPFLRDTMMLLLDEAVKELTNPSA